MDFSYFSSVFLKFFLIFLGLDQQISPHRCRAEDVSGHVQHAGPLPGGGPGRGYMGKGPMVGWFLWESRKNLWEIYISTWEIYGKSMGNLWEIYISTVMDVMAIKIRYTLWLWLVHSHGKWWPIEIDALPSYKMDVWFSMANCNK